MNEDNFILEDIDRELTFDEKVNKIVDEFNPEAVEYTADDNNGWSVKIKDKNSEMEFWVDVWVDTNYNDVETEWNQYIFDTNNDNDNLKNAVQENSSVFDLATSEAINYLQEQNIIEQDDKANWYVVYHTPAGEFYEIYEEDFNDETGDIEGAGRIWNVETGMEREFVFTFDVQGSAIYFNDFSTGDELDIRNENLINEIKSFADDHKDEIEHYITFTIDESKKVEEAKEDKYEFKPGYYEWQLLKNGKVIAVFNDFVDELPEKCTEENLRDFIDSYLLTPNFTDEEDYENKEDYETAQEFNKAIEGSDRKEIIEVILDRLYYEYGELNESKKTEAKDNTFKYNGYTFIPVGNVKSNLDVYDYISRNDKLNSKFDKENDTYNYDEFYKVMPPVDIFEIKELDNIRVMPGGNYLFEYTGDEDTIVLVDDIPNEEELKTPDSNGYVGMAEDKEVITDILDNDKDYGAVASKYGYSFNNYQLYNIATLYTSADEDIKEKIEDILEDINYHSECAEIMEDANKFKANLFESKKTEDVNEKINLDDIANYIKGIVDYNVSITPTEKGFSSYDVNFLNTDDSIMYSVMVNDDAIKDKVRLLNTLVLELERLYRGKTFADIIREKLLDELNKIHPVSKKTEDVAINNGFDITKYQEIQNLADDIANSIKDKDNITIDNVIEAIENWNNGFSSVITALATADKNLANEIEKDEYDRYEAENQFLGLVEDTLNDMGITVYDEYDLDDIDNEYDENMKIIESKGILKNIQKQDEIDEWEVFDAEIDKELGKDILDTFKNYEDDEDDVISNVRIDYNTDDGSYTVAYIDMFGGFHQIDYKLTDEELAELKGDKKTEDATQCGAVDGGRVSIFGEKEKIEEDNEYFSYVASRDVKETLNDLLSGNYDIMYDYNVENFVDDLIDYLDTLDDSKAHSIAWELNQACISAEKSNRRASGTKPRKLIQALKSAKAYLDNIK